MLSTVDLELTSFINSDLIWKNIKKGRRSWNRRSRKSVSGNLSFGVELGERSCKREPQSSNIGTKRLGVTVPGGRFTEKVADVPIKKRRFLIQSPSPSPRMPSPEHEESLSRQPNTSKHLEESELVLGSKCAAQGQQLSQDLRKSVGIKCMDSVDKVWNGRMFEVNYGEHECDDDFLGIKLLAAAACSGSDDNVVGVNKIGSSIIDDGTINIKNSAVQDFAQAEGNGSCTAAILLKEGIASSGTINSILLETRTTPSSIFFLWPRGEGLRRALTTMVTMLEWS